MLADMHIVVKFTVPALPVSIFKTTNLTWNQEVFYLEGDHNGGRWGEEEVGS